MSKLELDQLYYPGYNIYDYPENGKFHIIDLKKISARPDWKSTEDKPKIFL